VRDRLHVREPQLQPSLPFRLPEGLAPLHHHDEAVRASEPPELCFAVLDHLVVCSRHEPILRLLSYSEISFRKLQTVSYVDAFVRFGRGVELRWVEIAAPF